jgi:hypothetical protein
MPDGTLVPFYGGGTLVFDEYGRLKFNINNRLNDFKRQQKRVEHLWRYGALGRRGMQLRRFADIHRKRAMNTKTIASEQWLGPGRDSRETESPATAPEQLSQIGGQ